MGDTEQDEIKWEKDSSMAEIRTQGRFQDRRPALDEIVATGADIHLEQMSHESWWTGIQAGGKLSSRRFAVSEVGFSPRSQWRFDSRPWNLGHFRIATARSVYSAQRGSMRISGPILISAAVLAFVQPGFSADTVSWGSTVDGLRLGIAYSALIPQ